MATVRIQNNILEDKVDTFSVEAGITIEHLIREHTDGHSYDDLMVECYDLNTGKTYFASIENDTAVTNAIVSVNGKDTPLDYEIKENDIVGIVITPAGGDAGWDWTGAWTGGLAGALSGAFYGSSINFGWGTLIGAIIGFAVGFIGGGILVGTIKNQMKLDDIKSSKGIESEKLPDVRGASNQPLLDQVYPFVLGKHLVTPFIIGSPYNNISGEHGENNYIHVLYAVGYAPLRLTDFKLAEMFLAHNQRWSGNQNLKNVFHGQLHGTDSSAGSESDTGDIVNTWKNNDITIEILQQGQNGENVDFGNVYPYARVQNDVGANVLYIADGTLVDIDRADNISYKGLGLKNGLRNNPVYFTEQFPKSARVELDFANGLYKTRSETHDNKSTAKYYKIPCWVAIQWRVYSDDNPKSDGETSGELQLPAYDYSTESYTSTQRGWNSFSVINGAINSSIFTENDRNNDIDAHTGNNLKTKEEEETVYTDINRGWIGSRVFNLQTLGGDDNDQDGINEFRCVTSVDFVDWTAQNLLTAEERNSGDQEILAKKFKAYFFDGSNSTKSVEVRVVRVSPCYIDETVSTKDKSAFKFNDIFTWTTLTSGKVDGDLLTTKNQIAEQRPLPEDKARKLCIVALKAKTDNVDQLSNTIKKFSCVAQAFAPYYDSESHRWFPEHVSKIIKYYKPAVQIGPREWQSGEEITEQQFYDDRQNGIKSIMRPAGNDFVPQLINNVIRIPSHIDDRNRYIIPYNDKNGSEYAQGCDGTLNYCTNALASMFLLAGIGPQLGVDALGYEQDFYDNSHQLKSDFGDFNLSALAKWHEEVKALSDGSYYPSNGYHYDENGQRVYHQAGEDVKIFFTANAYIYQSELLENIFAKIAVAGRAVYTRDRKNRLTVVMDKKEKYPVALINQQNTLKSSYTISFEDLPSGLQLTYPDENDGYMQNTFYCMADGEDFKNPKGAIEPYSFSYVTNPYQQNSLGRYLLANRMLNREVVTKKIGIEGASIGLGNLVLVSDDTMLIGTDTGGRITKLLENDNLIFGFIINNTYKYTGEEEEYTDSNDQTQTRCKEGVVVLQPTQYSESRVITLRLAKKNTIYIIDEERYQMVKGDTNLVLFDTPISKSDNSVDGSDYYIYKPEVDNIVSFGIVGFITSTYRVIKIKSDSKRTFEFTLIKYQDDLYDYGRALPSFQNNMTIPDRSGENAFALSENVTQSQLIKALADASELAQGRIDDTFGNTPLVPQNLRADVKQDCIQLTCVVDSTVVNTVDRIVYEITKYRMNNGVLEELVTTINGSYSTEYFFDRTWEGYPEKKASGVTENDGSLDFWKIRARSISIYLDENGNHLESDWSEYVNISALSLLDYGTWLPPAPVVATFDAEQEGINAIWNCDLSNVYGSVQYVMLVSYNNTLRPQQIVMDKFATYQFDRSLDGYPEKSTCPNLYPGTKIIDNYSVVIRALNINSGKYSDSSRVYCDITGYKGWIPSVPTISPRVTNRNITLYMSQEANCYGVVGFLIGVRRYDDLDNVFYVPDLITNPYSRESAYKLQDNGVFIQGHIESESQFTQTMPLKTQNGVQGMLDYNESPQINKVLAIPVLSSSDNRILVLSLGGFAPIDTSYQFEVYAFNKTVESFYDNQSAVDHHYDITTYHKLSSTFARRVIIALATSVQDVLNGSIVSDKVGKGAITETKIEDDAITAPKIRANAVVADKMYSYNMLTLTEGAHTISGYAYNEETDEEVKELIDLIRKRKDKPDQKAAIDMLDDLIRRKSTNFWLGLDTEHPEFYMGNVLVAEKYREDANYFHYYYDEDSRDTNLDIKLSNFIVTAVSSTVKGYFNVRNKNGQTKYVGANSFLQVNPETRAGSLGETVKGYYNSTDDNFYEDSTFTILIPRDTFLVYEDKTHAVHEYFQFNGTNYYKVDATNPETMIIRGNLTVSTKSSDGQNGLLKVTGRAEIGELSVTDDISAGGDISATGDLSASGILTVTGDASVGGDLTVTGDQSVGGDSAVTGALSSASVSTGSITSSGDITSSGKVKGNSVSIGNFNITAISFDPNSATLYITAQQ